MAGTNFDRTIGSILIGVLFSTLFYACTCAQCIYYARNYPNDHLSVKALVVFLWTLDTVIVILDATSTYRYIVEWHANPLALISIPSVFAGEFFLVVLTGFVVQCYFIHKIWDLLGTKWYRYPLTIAGFAITIVSLAGGGGSFAVYVFAMPVKHLFIYAVVVRAIVTNKEDILTALKAAEKPKILQSVTTIVADLYIVVLLCLTLKGSSSGFKRTNRLIDKLIVYTVNRGTLTVALQLCSFLTYVTKVNEMDLVWIIFWAIGGKAYVNSLLAVLNVRQHLRDATAQRHSEVFQVLDFPRSQNAISSSQTHV